MKSILKKFGIVPISEIRAEDDKAFEMEFIQLGAPNIFIGDSACGKSAMMCALAAAISDGSSIAGWQAEEAGKVILLSVDDGPSITASILRANGAGDNVYMFDRRTANARDVILPEFATAENLDKIMSHIGDVKAVIIDSFKWFACFTDSQKTDTAHMTAVHQQVKGLQKVCNKYNAALIISAHGSFVSNSGEKGKHAYAWTVFDDYKLSQISGAKVYAMNAISRSKNLYGIRKMEGRYAQKEVYAQYSIGENRKIIWL